MTWVEAKDQINDWKINPLEDVGLTAPSIQTLNIALDLIEKFKHQPPPQRILAGPNGEITFYLHCYDEEYRIWEDGTIEYMKFENNKIIKRAKVNL